MLREEVASHYRERGYSIREHAQVRGRSGAIHTVDMVAQGPLGNLIIALEDAGGFEGPEMNAVRSAARDIGATPVMAARRIPEGLRRRASEAGVVLLDAGSLGAPLEPEPVFEAPEDDPYPPWPDPERRRIEAPDDGPVAPRPAKSTDPGFWRYPRSDAEATDAQAAEPAEDAEEAPEMSARPASSPGFQWLPKQAPTSEAQSVARVPITRRPAPEVPTVEPAWSRWIMLAIAAGTSAGAAFYLLDLLFG